MHIDDLILNVGQFLDDETNVIVGSVEVNVLTEEAIISLDNLSTMVDFNFHLYNMAYLNNNNELAGVTSELSEEEAYMVNALIQTKNILVNDYLVMTVSEFDWRGNFNTLENKMNVLTKFIDYCDYNNYDYLALMVEEEFTGQTKQTNVTEFPKIKQYEALGFERINIHKTPIMVKKLYEE